MAQDLVALQQMVQATQALQVEGACRTAVAVRDRMVQIATLRGPVALGEAAAKKTPAKKAAKRPPAKKAAAKK